MKVLSRLKVPKELVESVNQYFMMLVSHFTLYRATLMSIQAHHARHQAHKPKRVETHGPHLEGSAVRLMTA